MSNDHDDQERMIATIGEALTRSVAQDSPDERATIAAAIHNSKIGQDAAAMRANLAPELKAIVDAIGDANGRLYSGCVLIYEGNIDDAKRVIGLANDKINEAWKAIAAYAPAPPEEDLTDLSRERLTEMLRAIDEETEGVILDMTIGDEVRAITLDKLAKRRERVAGDLARRRLEQRARRARGTA